MRQTFLVFLGFAFLLLVFYLILLHEGVNLLTVKEFISKLIMDVDLKKGAITLGIVFSLIASLFSFAYAFDPNNG